MLLVMLGIRLGGGWKVWEMGILLDFMFLK